LSFRQVIPATDISIDSTGWSTQRCCSFLSIAIYTDQTERCCQGSEKITAARRSELQTSVFLNHFSIVFEKIDNNIRFFDYFCNQITMDLRQRRSYLNQQTTSHTYASVISTITVALSVRNFCDGTKEQRAQGSRN